MGSGAQDSQRQSQDVVPDPKQDADKDEDTKLSAQDRQVIEIADALFENRPLPISSEERSKEIFKLNNLGLLHCYSIVLL